MRAQSCSATAKSDKNQKLLWKNVVSLSCTKIASRKLLCNYNHLGWVPETWEIMLILARTQKNRSLIAYDTFLRDSWKRCKWNLSREDFYITLSSGGFFQASQIQRIFRRRRNEARKSWSYSKKVEEDEVSCGSFVVWCSKVVCFCGCSNCRPLCFIFSYYRNHLEPSTGCRWYFKASC